jgi:cytochrome c-type biogenesis protein CcmF
MGIAPHVHWKKQAAGLLWKKMRLSILISAIITVFIPVLSGFTFHWLASVGIFLSVWIVTATFQYAYSLKHLELKQWAMIIAHIGIAVTALGITINKSYSAERQVKIMPGESVSLSGYQFTFVNIDETRGANYNAITATFDVQKNNNMPEKLLAEQRIYTSHQETLAKPGILVNPFRDLYLALGNGFPDGGWSVRIYYKPMVRWIWAGGFLLLIGGLVSLLSWLKKRDENDTI